MLIGWFWVLIVLLVFLIFGVKASRVLIGVYCVVTCVCLWDMMYAVVLVGCVFRLIEQDFWWVDGYCGRGLTLCLILWACSGVLSYFAGRCL